MAFDEHYGDWLNYRIGNANRSNDNRKMVIHAECCGEAVFEARCLFAIEFKARCIKGVNLIRTFFIRVRADVEPSICLFAMSAGYTCMRTPFEQSANYVQYIRASQYLYAIKCLVCARVERCARTKTFST